MADCRFRRRRGLSRLEVVALVVAVGLMLQLLWPLLLRAREGQRRASCAAHLRQMAQAILAYEGAHAMFPPAAYWTTAGMDIRKIYDPQSSMEWWPNITTAKPGTFADTTHFNWAILTLPFLGEESAFSRLRAEQTISAPENVQGRMQRPTVFACPSDVYSRVDNPYRRRLADGNESLYARGNYAINGGSQRDCQIPGSSADPCIDGFYYHFDVEASSFQWWGNGVAGINKSLARRELTRGAEHVVLLEEVRSGMVAADSRGVWALGQIGGSITWGHGVNGDAGGPNHTARNADDIVGCQEAILELGHDRLVADRMGCCPHCEQNVQATARSMHSGGVNLAMADGGVRYVVDDIDAGTWHVMHSRTGPEEESQEPIAPADIAMAATIPEAQATDKGTIVNSIGMRLVEIPPGDFVMGLPDQGFGVVNFPEVAPHPVQITRPYYLGCFEVTQAEFHMVMGKNPSLHAGGNPDWGSYPVEGVTWNDASQFCEQLSQLPPEKGAGRRYRLPTEAEWEYACRGGSQEPYRYWQVRPPQDESGDNGGHMREPLPIAKVGSYSANRFGLHDMRGNVYEWCADWFARDYYANSPPEDPSGPATGTFKVMRGSDWVFAGDACIISRYPTVPWKTSKYLGFRVAMEEPESRQTSESDRAP